MRYLSIVVILVVIIVLAVSLANAEGPHRISWTWGTELPEAQSALGTVRVGDNIVVVGGTYWLGGRQQGAPKKIWSNTVKMLNTQTNQWESLPDYPLPCGYPLVVAEGSRIWVIGGGDANRTHDECFMLETSDANASWQFVPWLPVPRSGAKGGVIDGVIYAASGTEEFAPGKTRPAPDVIALDTNNLDRGWQYVADVPNPTIDWRMGTVCNGKVYLFGGLDCNVPSPVETAETVRTWHSFAPLIPQGEAYALDVATGTWETLRPLPIDTGAGAAVAIDSDHLMLVAGLALAQPAVLTHDGDIRTYFSTQCLLYDITRDNYAPLQPMLLGVADNGVAYVNGKVYVIGGEDSTYMTRTDMVEIGKLR